MSGRRHADTPEQLQALAKLGEVTAEYAALAERMDEVMARRNGLFVTLKSMGVTHREIAQHSGLTEMAVKKAIDKTTRVAA